VGCGCTAGACAAAPKSKAVPPAIGIAILFSPSTYRYQGLSAVPQITLGRIESP
jgi:hypothetical protein